MGAAEANRRVERENLRLLDRITALNERRRINSLQTSIACAARSREALAFSKTQRRCATVSLLSSNTISVLNRQCGAFCGKVYGRPDVVMQHAHATA